MSSLDICHKPDGKLFGAVHYSAVVKSSARFETEIGEDRKLATLDKDLMSNVNGLTPFKKPKNEEGGGNEKI